MPFITFKTTKTLTLNQEKLLKDRVGRLITIFPQKSEEQLMIHIEDNQVMYFKGQEIECMKIDCQLFYHVDLSYKKQFVEELMKSVEEITKIPTFCQYMTMSEYDHWGRNGEYI